MHVLNPERLDGKWQILAGSEGFGACPRCAAPSTARHGHYDRKLQDLPETGVGCDAQRSGDEMQWRDPKCKRRTFPCGRRVKALYTQCTSRVAE